MTDAPPRTPLARARAAFDPPRTAEERAADELVFFNQFEGSLRHGVLVLSAQGERHPHRYHPEIVKELIIKPWMAATGRGDNEVIAGDYAAAWLREAYFAAPAQKRADRNKEYNADDLTIVAAWIGEMVALEGRKRKDDWLYTQVALRLSDPRVVAHYLAAKEAGLDRPLLNPDRNKVRRIVQKFIATMARAKARGDGLDELLLAIAYRAAYELDRMDAADPKRSGFVRGVQLPDRL